jgi:hypothetical protein
MANIRYQRIVSFALVAVFGVLSAIPRNGLSALHLLTGDHVHLSYSADHGHDHDTDSNDNHQLVHAHADEGVELDYIQSEFHRHDCVKFTLPSSDYRSSMSLAGNEALQGWDVVPPIPICLLGLPLAVRTHRDFHGACTTFGLTPPELVGFTIFLI